MPSTKRKQLIKTMRPGTFFPLFNSKKKFILFSCFFFSQCFCCWPQQERRCSKQTTKKQRDKQHNEVSLIYLIDVTQQHTQNNIHTHVTLNRWANSDPPRHLKAAWLAIEKTLLAGTGKANKTQQSRTTHLIDLYLRVINDSLESNRRVSTWLHAAHWPQKNDIFCLFCYLFFKIPIIAQDEGWNTSLPYILPAISRWFIIRSLSSASALLSPLSTARSIHLSTTHTHTLLLYLYTVGILITKKKKRKKLVEAACSMFIKLTVRMADGRRASRRGDDGRCWVFFIINPFFSSP